MAGCSKDGKHDFVVNNMLCYITTARHSMKSDDIVMACIAFYHPDDIIKSKDLLFDLVGERPIRRRNENRILHEVQDAMELVKKCEEEGINIPSFVCDSYNGLPASSGFELIANHVVNLMGEISSLRKEVEAFRESRLVTLSSGKITP